MKKYIVLLTIVTVVSLTAALLMAFKSAGTSGPQYEYVQFSAIESVVPGGLGRSRIIYSDGKGTMIEKELQNLYSLVGLNLGNIASNDRVIVDRINDYVRDGWELFQVTAASQTNMSNGSSASGIFITRYLFRRTKA